MPQSVLQYIYSFGADNSNCRFSTMHARGDGIPTGQYEELGVWLISYYIVPVASSRDEVSFSFTSFINKIIN